MRYGGGNGETKNHLLTLVCACAGESYHQHAKISEFCAAEIRDDEAILGWRGDGGNHKKASGGSHQQAGANVRAMRRHVGGIKGL